MDTSNEPGMPKMQLLGRVAGFAFGFLVVLGFCLSMLDEHHALNRIPRLELFGLALCLIPSATWAGNRIAKAIGASRKDFFWAVFISSQVMNVFSVTGVWAGSTFGTWSVRHQLDFGWAVEIQTLLLQVIVGGIVFLFLTSALSWPMQIWFKRKSSVSLG